MKAIAVYQGKAHSMHLEEIPQPEMTNVPAGRGVLVKVLRVGVDGTNKGINEALLNGEAKTGHTINENNERSASRSSLVFSLILAFFTLPLAL